MILLGVRNGRWHHARCRGRIPGKGHLHQRLTVDGVVNRLAHFRVIERFLRDIHADVTLHDRRAGDQLQLAVFRQQRRLLVRDRESKLRFAGLQHGRAGVVIHHRTPGDGVQLRQPLLPVTGELFHLHKVGLIPGHQLIRPGADRMEADLFAVFFQRVGGDHRRGRVSQNIDKGRERLFQGNFYRGGIDGLGAGDVLIQVIALKAVFRVAGAIEVDLHRFSVEVGAVLELHPAAQLNGVDQPVVRDGVTLGQHVFQLHLFIETKQPLIKRLRHRLRQGVVSVIRIQGGEVGGHRHHHVFCCEGRRGRQGCRDARG